MRCDYCYWFRDLDVKEKPTKEQYTRVVQEIAKRPKASLLILGGEPTTDPALPDILEQAVAAGISEIAVGTNFIKPNKYFQSLPHRDKVAINISIHLDVFKNTSQRGLDAYIDKIIKFYKSPGGKKIRIGMVIDNRYADRVVYVMERLKEVKCMKYPILLTHENYTYYDLDQSTVDRVKPYFSEAFTVYKINGVEHNLLDDAVNQGPKFTGYWCNSNTIEVFATGDVNVTCSNRPVGNVYTTDDVIKNFNPLQRCTVPFCDNFNRILLTKKKYGKYT